MGPATKWRCSPGFPAGMTRWRCCYRLGRPSPASASMSQGCAKERAPCDNNLELTGGLPDNGVMFAFGWGAFPVLTG